jgi:hypothetical protein
VFGSHAQEKNVRKDNRRVDKKNDMGEARDDNHLRTYLKTDVNDENLCRDGWGHVLPDTLRFLTSRTASRRM